MENITQLSKKYTHKRKKQIHPFDVLNTIFMALFILMCIYPMIYVLAGSFNNGADYTGGGVYLFPRVFTLDNYSIVFRDSRLWTGYIVTLARTVIGIVTSILFTAIVAYAMSRKELPLKSVFYWLNIVTMFFGGGLIPYFLIIVQLNLYNSFLVYIIPGLYSVYNMIVISSFFKSIPEDLHESAIIDGASETRILFIIFMPLSKPVLATIALWVGVSHWNSFFDCMIYTRSPSLQTLQYFLIKVVKESSMPDFGSMNLPESVIENLSPKTISLAAIVVSVIPVLCVYPFIHKAFDSGVMIGSLKG